MKNSFLLLFACFVFSTFFTACTTYKLFPNRLNYTVIQPSSNSSKLTIPVDLMKVEGYKNKLNVYYDGKQYADFTIGPVGPLPPHPPPCLPAHCRKLTILHINGEYLLTIEDYKNPILLRPNEMSDAFTNLIKQAPNQQFILKILD